MIDKTTILNRRPWLENDSKITDDALELTEWQRIVLKKCVTCQYVRKDSSFNSLYCGKLWIMNHNIIEITTIADILELTSGKLTEFSCICMDCLFI